MDAKDEAIVTHKVVTYARFRMAYAGGNPEGRAFPPGDEWVEVSPERDPIEALEKCPIDPTGKTIPRYFTFADEISIVVEYDGQTRYFGTRGTYGGLKVSGPYYLNSRVVSVDSIKPEDPDFEELQQYIRQTGATHLVYDSEGQYHVFRPETDNVAPLPVMN